MKIAIVCDYLCVRINDDEISDNNEVKVELIDDHDDDERAQIVMEMVFLIVKMLALRCQVGLDDVQKFQTHEMSDDEDQKL